MAAPLHFTSFRRTAVRRAAIMAMALLPVAATTASAADECRVETSPGVFVSCLELLDRNSLTPGEKKPPPPAARPPKVRNKRTPEKSKRLDDDLTFAKDLTSDEAARLRDTKIHWDGKPEPETPETGGVLSALKNAGNDPSPLGQARRHVQEMKTKLAKLEREHRPWEKAGLIDFREEVRRAIKAQTDIERVALREAQRCRFFKGKTTRIKSFRMTAGGAVPLNDAEIRGQASATDDPACLRTELISLEQISEVQELHRLQATLDDHSFGYWNRLELREVEDRIAVLKKKHLNPRNEKRTVKSLKSLTRMKRVEGNGNRIKAGSDEHRMRAINEDN